MLTYELIFSQVEASMKNQVPDEDSIQEEEHRILLQKDLILIHFYQFPF